MGELDEGALARAMRERPSATLAMLADLSQATDEALRRAVQAVAARLVLDRCRVGRPRRAGVGRPRAVPATQGGDLDLDASLEAIMSATAEGRSPALDELTARDWGRADIALVVLLDHSGSMNGERLAAAAVSAAACALRTPGDHAVIAFARDVEILKGMTADVAPVGLVDRVLRLRGHGVTGLAGALSAAADQLALTRAGRRVVVLLSDCRSTDDIDPIPAGRAIAELVILAPADDCEQAAAFAAASGARFLAMAGADSIPALMDQLLA